MKYLLEDLYQRLNNSINIPEICSIICIFSISINKVLLINNVNFYYGKFNIFQSEILTLSDILIIVSALILIGNNYIVNKKINYNFEIIIFLLLLALTLQNFFFFTAILFSIVISNTEAIKNIKIFLIASTIQVSIAIYQFIFQKHTNIALLSFLGEPNLVVDTKGISKVRFESIEILRSYGTTAHPNILSSIICTSILFANSLKLKILNLTALITSASLSSIACLGISNFLNIKLTIKHIVTYTIIFFVFIGIVSFRVFDKGFESIDFRLEQTKNFLSNSSNITEVIFGTKKLTANNLMLPWEIQPLHNSYLYLLEAHGLIAFCLLIYILRKLVIKNIHIGIFIITIFLFDHFWFTTSTGILLFTFIYLTAINQSKKLELPAKN